MQKAHIVSLLVMVMLGMACADINQDFLRGARGLIGGDVNTGNLLGGISTVQRFDSVNDQVSNLNTRAHQVFDFAGIRNRLYERVAALRFGTNSKVQSLHFINQITQGESHVFVLGMYAIRSGTTFQIRSTIAKASARGNQQFSVQMIRQCKTRWFRKKCHDVPHQIPRGFFHNELELITTKLQRAAANAMVNEIKAKTGLNSAPEEDLSSLYIDEANRLRALYRQLEVNYMEMTDVPVANVQDAIHASTDGTVNDAGIKQRMQAVTGGNARSSFMVFPGNNFFYVFSMVNQGGKVTLRISKFMVDGQVPMGAFVSSTGNWILERPGRGSSPSVQQIMGIFPALK